MGSDDLKFQELLLGLVLIGWSGYAVTVPGFRLRRKGISGCRWLSTRSFLDTAARPP